MAAFFHAALSAIGYELDLERGKLWPTGEDVSGWQPDMNLAVIDLLEGDNSRYWDMLTLTEEL